MREVGFFRSEGFSSRERERERERESLSGVNVILEKSVFQWIRAYIISVASVEPAMQIVGVHHLCHTRETCDIDSRLQSTYKAVRGWDPNVLMYVATAKHAT